MNPVENLWEFDIRAETDVSPKRVMEAQAKYLMQMSADALRVHVQSSPGKGVRSDTYVHEFMIGTKPPLEFEYKLFEVRQTIDIYPLQVSSEPSRVEKECRHLDEFKAAVKAILNAESTQRRLRALYCQAMVESEGDHKPYAPEAAEEAKPVEPVSHFQPSPSEGEAEAMDSAEEPIADMNPIDSENDEPAREARETVPGEMSISELKSRFHLDFSAAGYDTVGQFLRAELGPGARTGARIERSGTILEIEETRGKYVTKVNVIQG